MHSHVRTSPVFLSVMESAVRDATVLILCLLPSPVNFPGDLGVRSHRADLNCGACGSWRCPINVMVGWWRRAHPFIEEGNIGSRYVFLKGLLVYEHVLIYPESAFPVAHGPAGRVNLGR